MRYTEHYKMKRPEQDDLYNVDDFGEIFEAVDGQQFRQDTRLDAMEKSLREIMDLLESLAGRVARLEDALFSKVTNNPFSVTFQTLDDAEVEGVWNRERSRIEC